MSKKDFQAIARAIYQASQAECVSDHHRYAQIVTRNAVADALATGNPRFNRALFIEACETGTCKGMKK
jgi:hypothetical protein